ncbi:MAG: RNA 2',3'-cyclic phosphodiesterase [Alphaproteobacteria bacterium]|nr:RNA 2',3'-cyclic phosphodiesterase [Alphaproteobacteria bacterium]NCB49204.1 RNA 2',3'-cyclic phosphodiesterase [Alphaproteobacteria bacterium]
MIRLFAGLELPEDVQGQIAEIQGGIPNARWVMEEKLHLNLCFIGNVEEPLLFDLSQEFYRLKFNAFDLSLKEIGYFATGMIPHHLWVGVSNPKPLEALNSKLERITNSYGIRPDRFKFQPHVSIAKLHGSSMREAQEFIAENNLFHTPEFKVYYFTLFSSHAREDGEGKYYRIEGRYPLVLE